MKRRLPTSIMAALVAVSFLISLVACDVGLDLHSEHSHARAKVLSGDTHGGNQTESPSLRQSETGSEVDLCCAISFLAYEFEPVDSPVNAPSGGVVRFTRAISPDIFVPSPIPISALTEG